MEDRVIEVNDLKLYYGTHLALKGVTTFFRPKSITALIGPSGCGKSTFLRTINRMNDRIPGVRVEGEILFGGQNIYAPDADLRLIRKRIGMVFQRPTAFPISVYDNVAAAARVHGITNKQRLDEIVENALADVGLWEQVKDRLRVSGVSLSLGEQQQLSLARVLATEPEVILLDEPASALDPKSTATLEELMDELAKRYTIIIVTHNMQQAARASQYTMFMLSGELVEYSETGKLFTTPSDPRTDAYVSGRLGG
ncbi:MAG: phosphate ABC transporter ATP-binding protein PstB [Bacillota bacterium]